MIKLKPKDFIKTMERNSNGSKPSRRRAIRLKFDPSSDNRIALDNRNVVKIDRSKSSSIKSQVDIRTAILGKAHSIPLITLRCHKTLALRSQSFPTSVQDLYPDCIPYF